MTNLTTNQKFSILLITDLILFYIMYLCFFQFELPSWAKMISVVVFIGINIFITALALNHIDTQDKDMALPIVALIVSSIALILVVVILVAIIFMLVNASKNGGSEK